MLGVVEQVRVDVQHQRPKIDRAEMRTLNANEIDELVREAPERYRTLLATATFTGLRAGETKRPTN